MNTYGKKNMKTSALSSGSSGNCFYVEKENSAVLIDAGISAKSIIEKLYKLNLNIKNINGIFITHEHSDHMKGADVLARNFNIPIYATRGTIKNCCLCSNEKLINEIKANEVINMNGLRIETFSKNHKASEPVSYSISQKDNKTISVITDLGYACKNVNGKISESDFLFLESNHDLRMLENGPYPYFLKKWIKSDSGHLSNNQSSLAVLEYGNSKLKNIVLSHLSKTNNSPKIAIRTFKNLLKERIDLNPNIEVSFENQPTQLFKI